MGKLTKVQVGPGVTWVAAPEAGLAILCGCPADVVKTLMQAGLVRGTEIAGRHTETGPNAILLSDVMLQNGAFCNLAEFPILQMLYRQGMILPGHPNNHGVRPLLIGNAQQVEAQLHYIHRGNYGLVGRHELEAAGIEGDLVDEILAYKERFAFGKVREPSELLDARVLSEGALELKGGVTVTRRGLNLFDFAYEGETVSVDLNLGPDETYLAPYKLPYSTLQRDYFSVIHSGDGNGWDPDRPSMGTVLVYQGRIYLIDAGPNINHTLDALGIGVNEVAGLFHTHCHDDHFAGLTTLLRSGQRLKYYATPLVRASVTKKLCALMAIDEAMFAECFEIHDLAFDAWNDVNGLDVMPLLSPHPVETSIFMFRALWHDGYRSYAHWADIVAREVLHGMLKTDQRPGISQAFFDRVIEDYQRPATLKKIDIGGGLIHGRAEDFRGDSSAGLLLSHIERPLSESEREIGGGRVFGAVDVLIAATQDYDRRAAFEHLRDYFPSVPHPELAMLLNCPIQTHEPGTLLLTEGQPIKTLHLIVGGVVERVSGGEAKGGGFTAGSLIGEVAGLAGRPATYHYRCRTYVKSLAMPFDLLREFLLRTGVVDQLLSRAEGRSFLRSTQICAEALSETTLTRLAQGMERRKYKAGETIEPGDGLALVASGSISLSQRGSITELLLIGGVFNEASAMFGQPAGQAFRAEEDCEIFLLPAFTVRDVPMLRWTLLEIFSRRSFSDILPFRSRKPLSVPPAPAGPMAGRRASDGERRRGDRRRP
ncbi:MAG TPA: cyclic nucleotide-binding domain-containing protein [Magnetospirillaceae bacterium]|nr:cyclic nucleotide-binding domain-containing protein [Magnetospirillaceae bacterium]